MFLRGVDGWQWVLAHLFAGPCSHLVNHMCTGLSCQHFVTYFGMCHTCQKLSNCTSKSQMGWSRIHPMLVARTSAFFWEVGNHLTNHHFNTNSFTTGLWLIYSTHVGFHSLNNTQANAKWGDLSSHVHICLEVEHNCACSCAFHCIFCHSCTYLPYFPIRWLSACSKHCLILIFKPSISHLIDHVFSTYYDLEHAHQV